VTPGGLVYHVLNRTVAGLPLFRKGADYEAFGQLKATATKCGQAWRPEARAKEAGVLSIDIEASNHNRLESRSERPI